MKTILLTVAILLLAKLSNQQDLDTTTTTDSSLINSNDFIELRKTICGYDGLIAETCLTRESNQTDETELLFKKRIVRSIETPISNLWSKLKSLADLIQIPTQTVQQQPLQHQQEKQQKQQQPLVTQIKCADETQRIQVIKADVTNKDLSVCPASTLNVDPVQNVCTMNRIQSTELAQKLCNNKNECNLSLGQDGFESICGCTTQKYLDLIYMCIPNNNEKKRTVRNKRNLGRRIGRGGRRGYGYPLYGGYGYGGLGGDIYDYALMSGYGVGFPRYGINSGFRLVGLRQGEGEGESRANRG